MAIPARANHRDPIAIVGIGCRFPGPADGPEELWRNLMSGRDAVGEIPPDRWNPARHFSPRPGTPGRTYTNRGGFLRNIDLFEPERFRISPREAATMDPQQRLLLETAWEAFEDAGQRIEPLAGSRTGVFIGISASDYSDLQSTIHDLRSIDPHTATGGAFSIAANRLSYTFDLKGPSVATDTACSSSLVALHLACRSLWEGESELALAGGSNLILTPGKFVAFCQATMLSRQGICRAFDAGADGFVRGEGAGVVVLKSRSRALADGDRIYALILGTAVNQDGRTPGITVPDQAMQEALLREACRHAGIAPRRIQYMEAHGTGTPVGDPIEANALGKVLSEGRGAKDPCLLGSVKTNLGHLEPAAGIAGLIKTALAIHHRRIPPNLHFERSNPHAPLDALGLRVPVVPQGWPREKAPLFAGVNSFGFGGTNAHAILRDHAPAESARGRSGARGGASSPGAEGTAPYEPAHAGPLEAGTDSVPPAPYLLQLSARSSEALEDLARSYLERFADGSVNGVADGAADGADSAGNSAALGAADGAKDGAADHETNADGASVLAYACATAALRRDSFEHCLSVVVRDKQELADRLEAFLDGERRPGMTHGTRAAHPGRVVFAFSGQGSQWAGMGRRLLDTSPVIRESIRACDRSLSALADWSVERELTAEAADSRLNRTAVTQVALFALQVALSELWKSWGVLPAAVIGHSVGEVAASHVAGALSLDDALRVVFHRGRAMDRESSRGGMLAAGLSERDAADVLAGFDGRVSVAAVNSPLSVTLSGDPAALREIAAGLAGRGIFQRMLEVEYAFHSPLLDPVRPEIMESMAAVRAHAAPVPIYSTVTGGLVAGPEMDAEYLWRGLRDRVLFAPAIEAALADGLDTFLEIGPHPVLSRSLLECAQARRRGVNLFASLRRDEDSRAVMLGSFGGLELLGVPVNRSALWPEKMPPARIPGHPWRRQSYWHEPAELKETRLRADAHPLLSRDLRAADPTWQAVIDRRVSPFYWDHRVEKSALFPAAGFLEMAAAAARRLTGRDGAQLEEVQLQRPALLPDAGEAVLQIRVDAQEGAFAIQSGTPGDEASWTVHCQGHLDLERTPAVSGPEAGGVLAEIRARLPQTLEGEVCYRLLSSSGLRYGPAFRGIREVRRRKGEALGLCELPPEEDASGYAIHPALLDACFQVMFAALPQAENGGAPGAASPDAEHAGTLFLPVHVRRARFFRTAGSMLYSHVRIVQAGSRLLEADLDLLDSEGNLVARIEGFRGQAMDRDRSVDPDRPDQWIYEGYWENHPLPHGAHPLPSTGFAPSVRELAAAAAAEGEELAAHLAYRERAPRIGRVLERIARGYIRRALLGAGRPADGHPFTEADLASALGVAPQHRRLFHRLLRILTEAGELGETADGMFFVAGGARGAATAEDPEALWREAWGAHAACHTDLTLLGRCGCALPAVLRGEVNPLSLLFPDGPTTTLATFYQDSPTFVMGNRMARAAVARVAGSLPAGRILRVLEVGGGTGGLTAHLLPVFDPERTSYLFTDIAPTLLSRAEQRFGDRSFVRYQAFDIDGDPAGQGLAFGSFDLIVASDVLHGSRALRPALSRLRGLLAPDGLLVLLEGQAKNPCMDVIFGATEGWWKFEDTDLRPDHPLLTRQQWAALLPEQGFCEVEAIPYPMDPDESFQVLLMAKKGTGSGAGELQSGGQPARVADPSSGSEPSPDCERSSGIWLLFADAGSTASRLRALLAARRQACVEVRPGEQFARTAPDAFLVRPGSGEDMRALLEGLRATGETIRGAVHLWNLDAAAPENTNLESLRRDEARSCHAVLALVQALARAGKAADGFRLCLATRGAQATGEEHGPAAFAQAPLLGLGRVLIGEHPELGVRMVDLEPDSADGANALLAELLAEDGEEEVALRGELRLVPRARRLRDRQEHAPRLRAGGDRGFRLATTTAGGLDSLVWEGFTRCKPGPGEVEVEVEAAGLNFRDVLKALALYPAEADDYLLLGDECAGRVSATGPGVEGIAVGDEVISLAGGCFTSHLLARAATVVPKPASLTFDEAATVPVAFLTAHYALHEIGRIRRGDSILIQAGAGGVGMAAIRIARAAGATVFATAGSPEKREILSLMGVDHVLDSRSLVFSDEVLRITHGRGVDLVLNSLAGKAIKKGLACLAPYGRFLELGKRDIYSNSRLGLWWFRRNLSFHAIDLGSVAREEPERLRAMFRSVLARFEAGDYHPLPHLSAGASRAVEAFRHVAQGRHVGKVVLSLRDPDLRVESRPSRTTMFRRDASYLVTGGLGGFGLVTARWLAERGAGTVLLLGRAGAATDEARAAVREIEERGARVEVIRADVTDGARMRQVLDDVRKEHPPLRGVFHTAVVMDDGIVLSLDPERFSRVLGPKAAGAWNLHELTRDLPLDHFVLFSSVSSWVGTPGQANYVAANAFFDAFTWYRHSLGLPSLCVNWGRLDEVGYVARHADVAEILTRRGFLGFSPGQAMEGLDRMLAGSRPQLGFLRLDWSATSDAVTASRLPRRLALLFGEMSAEREAQEEGGRIRDALRAAKPEEKAALLRDYVRQQVARVLGAPAAKLELDRPLNQLGFDSLMAVELKTRLDADLGVSLPAGAMMETPTVSSLAEAIGGMV